MGRTSKKEVSAGRKNLCLSTRRKSRKLAGKRSRKTSPTKDNSVLVPTEKVSIEPMETITVSVENSDTCMTPNRKVEDTMSQKTLEAEFDEASSSATPIRPLEAKILGRRIFDIEHFFKQILNGKRHEPFDCSLINMKVIREVRNGLASEFVLKCEMCLCIESITTEPSVQTNLGVNSSLVLGAISTGVGYSQINEIAASLNMPLMTANTFHDHHEKVGDIIRASAWSTMEDAAKEEREIALKDKKIDGNGYPCITVVTDGAWAKRSYNVNYDSASGVACIIGYNTGKILFLGIRNKYCSLCTWYENKEKDIPIHKCYKNWDGTSTSMETDIIVEGFKRSIDMYGIKFTRMVGDGDSSVYRRLLKTKPYGNLLVQKVECKNHLLRNFAKKVRDICNQKKSHSKNLPVPPALRKEVFSRFLRLRTAITKATTYRIKEDTGLDEKIELLRKDISNAPSHVYGEHARCKEISYFKCEQLNDKNLVPALKDCGIYDDLSMALQRLLDNTSSLVSNMDNNLAEHYNSIICKFVGGKRVNFAGRGSYQTRCEAAAVSFNSKGDYYRVVHKAADGVSPRYFTKKFQVNQRKRLLHKAKRRLFTSKKVKRKKGCLPDYGPDANYVPLDINSDIFKTKATDFLAKLKKTREEITKIERNTLGQSSNPEWIQERSIRLTASHFGQICKMRNTTSPINTVKNLLYGNFTGNKATNYGIRCEARAILDFERKFNLKIEKCGFFISERYCFLGASPDGLIGTDHLIEVKCPYSIRQMTPDQGITEGKIKFAEIKDGRLHLKRSHNYYYQVQGQMAITGRDSCYFIVWSPLGILVDQISKDDQFWENHMIPKLTSFYNVFVLPEIVDPLFPKGLTIRSEKSDIILLDK